MVRSFSFVLERRSIDFLPGLLRWRNASTIH
jgi:hypothetical protein